MQERNRMLKSPPAFRKAKAQVETENKESGLCSTLTSTFGPQTGVRLARHASRAPHAWRTPLREFEADLRE